MSNKKEVSYWALPIKKVFENFNSSEHGLTNHEAEKRLKYYGYNDLKKAEKRHGFNIFLSQFKNAFILILLFASILSYFLGNKTDSIIIALIILLSAGLGFFQEYRSEVAMRELKKYIPHNTKVLRDGELIEINSKELVVGDIVVLRIGNIIPADIRLFNVEEMTTDESALTGESLPVIKEVTVVNKEHSSPQHLKNIAFAGTAVSSGLGKGIVITTGNNTFFGQTAVCLAQKIPEADFQKNIHKFSNYLLKIVAVMTFIIFISNAVLGKGIFTSFLFAVALAVGITPEVLPIVMTVALSSGAMKMAKEKVITKRLASVEDFGNIDTLCCDKTGTLTEGRLKLWSYASIDKKKDNKLILYGLLCNSVRESKTKDGNSVDKAIWESKEANKLLGKVKEVTILDENEFDFTTRRMSIVIKGNKINTFVVKGAPDVVLEASTHVFMKNKKKRLNPKLNDFIRKEIINYEKEGYKVIAVGEKNINKTETSKKDEKGFIFLGFLLFLDPPKKTAKKSLKLLQEHGVNIKVLTGDSPFITKKICYEVGLKIVEDKIIMGEEISNLNRSRLNEISQKYNVFARITPEQKYKIVASLKKKGHIVGFLGDGINDAAALKIADVGISVSSAVDIAKESADIILLKKSLRVLDKGIIEGRKTFGNITKYILNTISANYGNMFTVVIASLFLKFIPLLPKQILLTNLISDFPLLTLSTDKVDEEFIKKPKRWDIKLISRFMIYFGLISSFFDFALIIPLIVIFKVHPELFRTSWFVLSIFTEVIITFAIRTRLRFYKSRPSKLLLFFSLLAMVTTVVLPYTLFGNKLFELVNIPITILGYMGFLLLSYFIVVETLKHHFFKKFEQSNNL